MFSIFYQYMKYLWLITVTELVFRIDQNVIPALSNFSFQCFSSLAFQGMTEVS
jgi:hypothetical protein